MTTLVQQNQLISDWLSRWQSALTIRNERRLVVLPGGDQWRDDVVQAIVLYANQTKKQLVVWGEGFSATPCTIKNYRHLLGQEHNIVVFKDDAFHPDAFAALSGTLVAGGMFFWLPSQQQQSSPDAFISRLWQNIHQNQDIILCEENNFPEPIDVSTCLPRAKEQTFLYDAVTQDQERAVTQVLRVAQGHNHRPLVLTADRGRGKSSALALAAAHLLHAKSHYRIALCAPMKEASTVFYRHLSKLCPDAVIQGNQFVFNGNELTFYPIDKLLYDSPDINLLLVDEAAAIPVYLLIKVARQFNRVVYSSTQHGYEGAGRGFAIKFTKTLARLTPDFNQYHIDTPIRWGKNDPLEAWVFKCFLFGEPRKISNHQLDIATKNVHFCQLTQTQLCNNEALLGQVFDVLIRAHYQTSPSDLKLLLTNPASKMFVVATDSSLIQILGVALIIEEGKLDTNDVALVASNKRQLKNQFFPQYLYRHCLFDSAFEYCYWRVSRIAILEPIQGQGLGTQLLNYINAKANSQKIDALVTSFAANSQTVKFWQSTGLKMVGLGVKKDKASGEYAAFMMRAVSNENTNFIKLLAKQFSVGYFYKLSTLYPDLEPELVRQIVVNWHETLLPSLTATECRFVEHYIAGRTQLAQAGFAIQTWLSHQLPKLSLVADELVSGEFGHRTLSESLDFLVCQFWLNHSQNALCQRFNLTGKKQIEQLTKAALIKLSALG